MQSLALAVIVLTCLLSPSSAVQSKNKGSHWEYHGHLGFKHWYEHYVYCGKEAQSPINIQTQDVHYDSSLKPIQLKGYSDLQCHTFTLSNNGHTVQVNLPASIYVSSLPKQYRAAQLHFHWGSLVRPNGSEHLIDGERSPAEMHIVHYNSEYRNMSEAMRKPDGLLVLGILLEVGYFKNPGYENILRHLESVRFAGQEVKIPSFNIQSLLPKRLDQYFTYRGSLTTPPCFQSVRWIIFLQRVHLSLSQLNALRTGLFHSAPQALPRLPLIENFRSAQPLGKRRVKASFAVDWAIKFRKAVRKLLEMLSSELDH